MNWFSGFRRSPLVCPKCIRKVNPAEIMFLCTFNRDHPKFTGVPGALTAECPVCDPPRASPLRECPRCKQSLLSSVGSEEQTISLCGTTVSGKSHFMVAIHNEFDRRYGTFQVTITIQPETDDSVNVWDKDYRTRLIQHGKVIKRTTRGSKPLFSFRAGKTGGSSTALIFFRDVAGEHFNSVNRIVGEMPWFRSSRALLILLEPLQFPHLAIHLRDADHQNEDRVPADTLLGNIAQALRISTGTLNRRVAVPTAICINKLDLLSTIDNRAYRVKKDGPLLVGGRSHSGGFSASIQQERRALITKDLLQPGGFGNLEGVCDQHFENWELFAVSATGQSPVEDPDGEYWFPNGIDPKRVHEPFLWLLSELKVVDTLE